MQDLNNDQTIPPQPDPAGDETAPIRVGSGSVDTSPTEVTLPYAISGKKPKKPRSRRWLWVLAGILLIFVFGGAGVWAGYNSAVDLRKAKMDQQRVTVATEQFMLGVQAQTDKNLELARRHFEYVIQLDPKFPGAQDKLRDVMVAMAIKNTPTTQPTIAVPTLTPTPDTRPQEDIYAAARQQFAAKDWPSLFATIDTLRKVDPKFHAVEIDDMLYVALRDRGIDKIIHQANLEGGLYDLALAEQFGPLDVDALGYRNWARLYLNGASFWEVDWVKVMDVFEQIYPSFPNMRDSSGLTAIERYRIAAKSYGDQLADKGDSCGAYDYYEKSLKAVPDGALEQKATEAYNACHPPEPTATATVPATLTPTAPPQATVLPTAEATAVPVEATATFTPVPAEPQPAAPTVIPTLQTAP